MVRRYVLIRILSENRISSEQFNEILEQSVMGWFGKIGFVAVNPKVIKFDADRSEAIVACERDRVAELQTALALTTDFSGATIALITLSASGTIKRFRRRRAKLHFKD